MLQNITKTCSNVMNNSKYVKINYNNLNKFIGNVDSNNLKNWLLFNPYKILNLNIEDLINFIFVFESIDYSFWGNPKWTVETDSGLKDGSDALLYLMLKYANESKDCSFDQITYEQFSKLFRGNIEIPLLRERYETIVNNRTIVNSINKNGFYKAIYSIKTDIELFDFITINFSSFKDERIYNGYHVYFYKLAQLLTSDILHIREEIEGIEVDYSNLIGCADYKIPQTLRALNIIEYNDELSNIIDSKQEISISSKYEVEIRASQIVVLDYIKSKLKSVSSMDVNDFLFLYSKKVKDIVKPYHLCRNKNY